MYGKHNFLVTLTWIRTFKASLNFIPRKTLAAAQRDLDSQELGFAPSVKWEAVKIGFASYVDFWLDAAVEANQSSTSLQPSGKSFESFQQSFMSGLFTS